MTGSDPPDPAGRDFPRLLAAAVAGDQEAFRVVWRARHPPLVRYLRVLCGDAAEDVAADTWLAVIPRLATFQGDEAAFGRWLVVIARNRARDVARRAARHPETPAADPPDVRVTGDAADAALETITTRAALALVATLPREQAEMVALRVVVGLDVADVAAIVGRSPGAVRVAVHRGLRALAARPDAAGRSCALAQPAGR
ncbi:MAG: RNA polymerase sigma factor [Kineosporiaceae bacterium]